MSSVQAERSAVMSSKTISSCAAVAALSTAGIVSYNLWKTYWQRKKRRDLRCKLPTTLESWRGGRDRPVDREGIWSVLHGVFEEADITVWKTHDGEMFYFKSPDGIIGSNNGYMCTVEGTLSVQAIGNFETVSALLRPARTKQGTDVVLHVIAIGNQGYEHLQILRKIATGENSLLSNNHALPLLSEFTFEDITFGIFPRAGGSMVKSWDSWPQNTVGDIVDLIMQMLEGLAFIHKLGIAHRDAFHNNFVVQWHPQSLFTGTISPSRPRVYIIDFEVAVMFPPECPEEERVCRGYPLGGTFPKLEMYGAPRAPECASGEPYSPFKLDVWQLGCSLANLRTTIPEIDAVLLAMFDDDPALRPSAQEALEQIGKVVHSRTPQSLQFATTVRDLDADQGAE